MYPCCTNGHSTYMQWLWYKGYIFYLLNPLFYIMLHSFTMLHCIYMNRLNATLMRIIHISWNRYLWIFFAVLHRNYINSRNYKHTSFIFSVYEEKMSGHWANRAIQACHVPMTIRKQGDWSGKFHVNSHCPIVLDWQIKAYL